MSRIKGNLWDEDMFILQPSQSALRRLVMFCENYFAGARGTEIKRFLELEI